MKNLLAGCGGPVLQWRDIFDDEAQARAFGAACRKAMEESTTSGGGALVADDYASALVRATERFGVFRRLAVKIPMRGEVRRVPAATGQITAAWLEEAQAFSESEFPAGQVTLQARKLGALVRVPNETMEDSDVAIATLIAGKIGEAFAKKEDDAVANGNGTGTYGRIVGLLKHASIATVTMGAGKTGFANIIYDNFADLEASVDEGVLENCRYFMHRGIFSAVLKMANPTTNEIVGSALVSVGGSLRSVPTINKYPVEFVRMMPALAGTAASTEFIAFGDPSFIYFGQRTYEQILFSPHASITKDETLVRGKERVDFQIADASAFAKLKTAAT